MKREKKSIYVVIISIITVIATISASIALYKKYTDREKTIMTIDGVDVKDTEYNFYYTLIVNSYYITCLNDNQYLNLDITKDLSLQKCLFDEYDTWADFFDSMVQKTIVENHKLYEDLTKHGFSYNASEEWAEFNKQIIERANNEQMTVSRMIRKMYGSNAAESNIKELFEKYITVNKYRTFLSQSAEITDKDIDEAYEKNKNDYDKVTYLMYEVSAEVEIEDSQDVVNKKMEQAKIMAKKFYDSVYSEETFIEQAKQYSGEKEPNVKHENEFYKDVDSSIAEWVFSCEEEKQTVYIEDSKNYCYKIVYFISRSKDISPTATIRQILFTPDSSTGNFLPTEQDYEISLKEADSVLNEFYRGEKTEESFAELAKKFSDDAGSAQYGGLINFIETGQYENDMDKWIFDSRESGDVEIVRTTYGYHILYFIGYTEPIWKMTIESSLRQNYVDNYIKNITKDCDIKYSSLEGVA